MDMTGDGLPYRDALEAAYFELTEEQRAEIGRQISELLPRSLTLEWAKPPALTLGDLAVMMRDMPRLKQREFRCHADVVAWLRASLPDTDPPFPRDAAATLTGVPVIEKAEMEPGRWEIWEDGQMIKSGRLGP